MGIKIKNKNPKTTDFSNDDIVINHKEGTLFFKSDSNLIKIQSASLLDNVSASGEIKSHNVSASGEIKADSGSFKHIVSPDQSIIKYNTLGVSSGFISPGIGISEIGSTFVIEDGLSNNDLGGQIGSTFVVGPTLNIKGGIGADNLDIKGKISASSFVGDGSKLTNLPASTVTSITGDVDVSAGTLTTSTAQKKTIVDDAGHTEVLMGFFPANIKDYASANTIAGSSGAANQWYGPEFNNFFWQENYGPDGEVVNLPAKYQVAGHIVPFDCILLGFQAVIVHEFGTTNNAGTFALYTGDGSGATFDVTSGGAGNLTIVQRVVATFSTPGAAGNPMKASVTNGTTALSAGDMIYPRYKQSQDNTKDIYMTYNILIKRN